MIVTAATHMIAGKAADRTVAGNEMLGPLAEPGKGTGARSADAASDPLAILGNFVEDAARSRKAMAEDRLKYLEDQISTLSLFDLAPGFLAGYSARLVSDLESAALEFAGAFKTLNHGGRDDQSGATLPAAYHDVLSQEPGGSAPTPEDRDTAGRFASTAQTLRSIFDIAGQDNEDGNRRRALDHARGATIRVEALMGELQSGTGSAGIFW